MSLCSGWSLIECTALSVSLCGQPAQKPGDLGGTSTPYALISARRSSSLWIFLSSYFAEESPKSRIKLPSFSITIEGVSPLSSGKPSSSLGNILPQTLGSFLILPSWTKSVRIVLIWSSMIGPFSSTTTMLSASFENSSTTPGSNGNVTDNLRMGNCSSQPSSQSACSR